MLCAVSVTPRARRVLAVLLALGATAVAADRTENRYVPDPDDDEAPPLRGATWVDEGPGYAIQFQQIDEAERRAYLSRIGTETDPFAAPPDAGARFLTFALLVENRSGGDLVFQPQNCWLTTNSNEILYPIGIEGLRSTYQMLELDLPPAYETSAPALLENATTLDPGQTLSGLLVYRHPKRQTRRFRVDVQLTSPAGDVVRFSAPYRRLGAKEVEGAEP
jgi:hypothetical protein